MKQRVLLTARDSVANPYVTFRTWVNTHTRLPVSSLQFIHRTSFLTELPQNSLSRRATAINILQSALFLWLILEENYAFLKPGLEKSKT